MIKESTTRLYLLLNEVLEYLPDLMKREELREPEFRAYAYLSMGRPFVNISIPDKNKEKEWIYWHQFSEEQKDGATNTAMKIIQERYSNKIEKAKEERQKAILSFIEAK